MDNKTIDFIGVWSYHFHHSIIMYFMKVKFIHIHIHYHSVVGIIDNIIDLYANEQHYDMEQISTEITCAQHLVVWKILPAIKGLRKHISPYWLHFMGLPYSRFGRTHAPHFDYVRTRENLLIPKTDFGESTLPQCLFLQMLEYNNIVYSNLCYWYGIS